jgi:hypothetical protein
VAADPVDLVQLDPEGKVDHVGEAWDGYPETEVVILEAASFEKLHEALTSGPFHVLHFLGHGAFNGPKGEGALVFERQDKLSQPVVGLDIAQLVKNFPDLRLIVLNACSTAMAPFDAGLDPFAGVATALVQGGLPAVLAMQVPISDRAAARFSRDFYRRLAAGDSVEAALHHGRLAVHALDPGSVEWATPVLFLRSEDGRLFERSDDEKSQRHAPADLLQSYLDWIIDRHSTLELRGLRNHGRLHLPLEKLFVALKGDRTHPFERAQARLALERELETILESRDLSMEEVQAARWSLLAISSVMPSLETRDRPFVLLEEAAETLTLGEAYRQHRRLVILGDPGSGKTTLARWLALIMACALQKGGEENVTVPLHQVDPEIQEGNEDHFLLGRARLPVLVRIAEYAEDRLAAKAKKEVPRTLTEFLGHHTWLTSVPNYRDSTPGLAGRIDPEALNELILNHLEKREALIILDGLDEVPASIERDEILEEVHTFVRRWIDSRSQLMLSREKGQIFGTIVESPSTLPGNQLIVTSRIAGYHASPLQVDLPHLTIEPMRDVAVDRFCDAWMQAVHESERETGERDEPVRARAEAEAKALKREIHSPKRRKIRALASNPLLAGVLATVFHNERARLPEQRVRLYEAAVRNLADVWQRRMHQSEKTGLDESEVFDLMELVASHIHQHAPSGLIPENQLAELATHHLAQVRGDNPLKPSPEVRRAVRSFLQVLREDVGLLAARGEGVYGFLHLTFQEYLAARFLVRDLHLASQKLMDKADDPRWREPLLMALGYASLEWPGTLPDLLRNLLRDEGGFQDLLPRGALLITAALPEMAPLSAALARELAEKLLRSYADREGLARFEALRELLEKAFGQLRQNGHERHVEEVLRSALAGSRPGEASLAPAAAALVERLEWYSPRLVQALMEALPYDNPAWDWPVDRALRKAVTPPAPEPPTAPRAPKEDPLLAQYRRELELTNSKERQEELQQRVARLEENHARALQELERQQEEFKELQKIYATAELPLRCQIPTENLPFRRALEKDLELVERIVGDPDWFRLTLAIYGGMRDYQTPASIREYEQIASYLQLSDNERTPFVHFYKERWGGEDTIYDMAVYLDVRAGRLNRIWKKLPRFAPANIYRDSRLTGFLLEALQSYQSPESLTPGLWRIWQAGEDSEARAEALIALLALGEKVGPVLHRAWADPFQHEAAGVASNKLSRLTHTLSDPVARASSHAIPGLRSLAENLEPRRWTAAVAAVIATAMSHGAHPLDVLDLLDASPESEKSYIFAEHLGQRIVGSGNDAIYDTAVTADSFAKNNLSPEFLVTALVRVSESRHLERGNFQFGWSVEKLPAQDVSRDDIPLSMLGNLEGIHPSIGFLREAILQHLKPLLSRNPDLLPEVLALSLGSRGDNDTREGTSRVLYPLLVGRPAPWKEVTRLAFAAGNPYHRARALLRLSEHLPQERDTLVAGAQSAIKEIGNPHEKVQVLERLIQLSPVEQRATLVKEALRLVPKISDPRDLARAFGRFTAYVPSQQGRELLEEGLARTARLREETMRAETLRALLPLLFPYPDLFARAQVLAEEMPRPWCRSLALDLHGAQLLPLHPTLASTSPEAPHLWAPLVLSALLRDLEPISGRMGSEILWIELGKNPGPQTVKALRQHALAQGLVLTRIAAQVLDQLLDDPRYEPVLESILPLLERQEIETLAVVEPWLDHPNTTVARYAALCVAEAQGFSERTAGTLLELLLDERDLWRHRAARLIHHPAISPDEPTRTVSGLGQETIEALVREGLRQRLYAPQVTLITSWMAHDLVYDSVEIFANWLQTVEAGGIEVTTAEAILQSIEEVTESVWQELLMALSRNHPAVQVPLLTSICRLHHKEKKVKDQAIKRISNEQWAAFLERIHGIDLERLSSHRIYKTGPLELVQAARQALERREELSDHDLVALADKLQRDLFSTSFADILRLDPEQMKTEMKSIASKLLYAPAGLEFERALRAAAIALKENHDLFRFALLWLQKMLQNSAQDPRLEPTRYYLLLILSAASELSPATFSNLADPEELEPLLIQASKYHDSYPGRAAAVTLLGYLRQVTPEGFQALHSALKDVGKVQQSALEAVLRFRRLDGDILPLLFEGLYHPSAMMGYATAQLLASLGRSDHTLPEQRRQILEALAAAVRDPRSERVVYFGYVNARVPALPLLNHAYYDAMMRVAGLE